MPLTLQQLFAETAEAEFDWSGETVHLTWAPARYTGEMDDLAEHLSDEEERDETLLTELTDSDQVTKAQRLQQRANRRERKMLREILSTVLVSWDVLDGDTPVPTTMEQLNRLPDIFIVACFLALSRGNAADPTNAPSSDGISSTAETSAPSLPGTPSSEEPTTSASPSTSSSPALIA